MLQSNTSPTLIPALAAAGLTEMTTRRSSSNTRAVKGSAPPATGTLRPSSTMRRRPNTANAAAKKALIEGENHSTFTRISSVHADWRPLVAMRSVGAPPRYTLFTISDERLRAMRLRLRGFVLFFVVFSSLACTGAIAEEGLRIGMVQEPATLNPIVGTLTIEDDIAQLLFSGLTRRDRQGNIIPDLAERVPTRAN